MFLNLLPMYFLIWPCQQIVPLRQFQWTHDDQYSRTPAYYYAALDGLYSPARGQTARISNQSTLVIDLDQMLVRPVYGSRATVCSTMAFLNAIIPLVEYAATGSSPKKSSRDASVEQPTEGFGRVKIRPNSMIDVDWMLYNTYVVTFHPGMEDLIVLDEALLFEMLSQKQNWRKVVGSDVTLWNSLVDSFDVETILLAVTGMILPICLVLSVVFGGVLKHAVRSGSLRLYGYCQFVCRTLLRHLIDTFALLLGDAGHLLVSFYNPTVRRARMRITRISLACWFTTGGLVMCFLYDKLFDNSLLSDLIDEPVRELETLSQIVPLMALLNLTFCSVRFSFRERLDYADFPGLQLSPQDYDSLKTILDGQKENVIDSSFDELYKQIRPRNVIINTDNLGCEFLKRTDPAWHLKKYHCYRGYAVKQSEVFLLNRRTLSKTLFVKLRRLCRNMVESGIQRHTHKIHIDRHQLASMAAGDFESHEETQLSQLKLEDVSRVLLDDVVMLLFVSFVTLLYLTVRRVNDVLRRNQVQP